VAVKVKVRVNRRGVRQMLGAPFMLREMERRGENVRFVAQQIAPVRTGRYRASILVRSDLTPAGAARAHVVADTPYAYFLERGTRYMRARRILGRALSAAAD
jgi:HK97 gp10 family phage protein